jgi:four helix bundle protein
VKNGCCCFSSAWDLRRVRGMNDQHTKSETYLPHHKLRAYGVAVRLLMAVRAANVRDTKLRDEAMRAAKSACLNTAEGAGRVSPADKARAFAIARGEAVEAVAAVEIAAITGDAKPAAAAECVAVANELVAMLTKLIRR